MPISPTKPKPAASSWGLTAKTDSPPPLRRSTPSRLLEAKPTWWRRWRAAGLEIIIGGKNDASFGPTVLVGLGGTAAEAMGDVSMRLAPLTIEDAREMLSELKAHALFDAWRGGPQYDKAALADTLVKIGELMIQHPEIREMDINPVRVFTDGLMVLDALIVC